MISKNLVKDKRIIKILQTPVRLANKAEFNRRRQAGVNYDASRKALKVNL